MFFNLPAIKLVLLKENNSVNCLQESVKGNCCYCDMLKGSKMEKE